MPEQTVRWIGGLDGRMEIIDQTLLPVEFRFIPLRTAEEVWEAIKALKVRGAPAIGVAAAMGLVVALQQTSDDEKDVLDRVKSAADYLATSRPTAVNLFWALDRMKSAAAQYRGKGGRAVKEALLAEAKAIRDEDAQMCRAIGTAGEHLITHGCGILTHCNAGQPRHRRVRHGPRAALPGPRDGPEVPRLRRRDAAAPPGLAPHGVGTPAGGDRTSR